MKKIVLLSYLLIITTTLLAQSYDFSKVAPSGQTLYYKINSDGTSVTVVHEKDSSPYYTTKPTGNLTIPSTVTKGSKTYTVTSIGGYAFYNCSGLTGTLTIPNSVTEIKAAAFEKCTGLTSVTIPNSVTHIESGAFYGCTGLPSFAIPNSVTKIGMDVFKNTGWWNKQSNGIIYKNGWCLGYKGSKPTGMLSIQEGTKGIADYAFKGCFGLTGTLTIPNSVTYIGHEAFDVCKGLTGTLTIPNSVTTIEVAAFFGCSGLTGTLTIPNSVTSIGFSAFQYCTGLTSVTISNSITSISTDIFSNCTGLTSITIPNSVTTIKPRAFENCSGLTCITIPSSVTSIEYKAFYGCSGLAAVYCEALTPPDGNDSINQFSNYNIPLYVPASSIEAYRSHAVWGQFTTILPISNTPYTVSVSVNNASMGTATGGKDCNRCETITLTATPNTGYHFVQWSDGNTDNARTVIVTKDTSFTAIFAADGTTYAVNTDVNDPSMGSVSGGGEYSEGETVTLIATPKEGYHFVKWSDENTDNPRTITVTGETNLTAIFAINTYTVTATTDDASKGNVTGGGTYNHGETATLTAIPEEGYHFVQWSDGNTDNARTVTATRDSVFTAIFAINTYTVTVAADDASKGSVTGGGTYNHGETATLTATPNAGYCFFGWSDGSTENPRGVTATQDSTITAIFDFKRRNHTATVCQGEAYAYQDSVFNTTTAGTFSKEVRFSNAYDCDSVVTVNLTVTSKSSASGIMLKDTCFEMGKATQLKVESPSATATYRFYDSHHALLHTGTEYTTAPLSSEEVFYVTMQEPSKCESAEKSITVSECVTPTHLFQLHKTVDNASVCKNSIVTITTVIEKLTPALIHKIQIIEDFGFADLKLLTAELKIDGKTVPYTRDVAHNKLFFNMGELSGIGTYTLTITARAFPNLGPKTETTTIRWANYPTGITETATFNVVD